MLECSCHIISYLADVMNALRLTSGQSSSALLVDGEEKAMEVDSDWVEDLAVEDDDSQAEDSVRTPAAQLSPALISAKLEVDGRIQALINYCYGRKTDLVQLIGR